ncbi:MAG: amino acid ABC transporter permease [Halanaerobiales bacterium]|nr:amino acid ABC transporter permease [Halanaerobiales bacterium]
MSSLPNLLEGALVTIRLTFFSLLLGLVLGIPLAFGQTYGPKIVRKMIGVYEKVVRSIPLLVILFLIYYGLPRVGIKFPSFIAAVIGIGIRSSAYQSQIYKGAIQSISGSQMKAALSLGMSKLESFRSVILPQSIRIAIPPMANESAIVLKDTSLAYALGVIELLRQGGYIISTTYRPLPIYLTVAAVYLVMTLTINTTLGRFEKKLKIPGIGIEERVR